MTDGNTEHRVIEDVRTAARALPPGSRLPSVRELMARHRASPVTVQRALARLAGEGLVVPRPGPRDVRRGAPRRARGIRRRAPDLGWQEVALADRPPLRRGLAGPAARRARRRRASRSPAATSTPTCSRWPRSARRWPAPRGGPRRGAGSPSRAWRSCAAWFAREAGGTRAAHDVVICTGGQPALATAVPRAGRAGRAGARRVADLPRRDRRAARRGPARGAGPGRRATACAPTCWPTRFALTGARVFYCQPLYANPTGASLAPDRRAAVLEAVAAAGAFLIEDDWARDLRHRRRARAAAAGRRRPRRPRRVRAVADQVRRAAACASPPCPPRGAAGARLRPRASSTTSSSPGRCSTRRSSWSPPPPGAATCGRCAARCATRRDALVAALGEHLPDVGGRRPSRRAACTSGSACPTALDDVALTARAAAAGVLVSPGRPWFAAEPPGPHLRLTYGGAPAPDLAEGVRRLASVAP